MIFACPFRFLPLLCNYLLLVILAKFPIIAEHLSARQLILQRRPIAVLAFDIYVAMVSHVQECNYHLTTPLA